MSSARPDDLEGFPAHMDPFSADLRSLADSARRHLRDFVEGSGEISVSLDPDGIASDIDELTAESDHLANWVASVGRAFREAGTDIDGDGSFSAGDNALSKLVGEPTVLEADAATEGQAAAQELVETLRTRGIDPANFDAHDLIFIDDHGEGYEDLRSLIRQQAGRIAYDEDYAIAYYDVLGEGGIRSLLGIVDRMAALDGGDSELSTTIADLANGWAKATASIDLAEERSAMLDPDEDLWWQQHQLTLLMAANGSSYDPAWLADAADAVLVSRADGNRYLGPIGAVTGSGSGDPYDAEHWYPGTGSFGFPYADHELAVPGLVALRALAGNDAAANDFALRSSAHRDVLVHPDDHVWTPSPSGETEQLQGRLHDLAGDTLVGAFLDSAYASDVDRGAQLDAYDDVMRLVGEGDVPDVIKRDSARTLLPYLPEIGEVAGSPGGGDHFLRPTYVGFVEELGYDNEATKVLGAQLREYGDAVVVENFADGGYDREGWGGDRTRLEHLLGATYGGLGATERSMQDANESLGNGLQQGLGLLTAGAGVVATLTTGPLGGSAVAGGSSIVNTVGGLAAEDIKNQEVSRETHSDDLTRILIDAWRQTAVDTLVADGEIDRPDAGPAGASGALEGYLDANDPISEIAQSSLVEGDGLGRGPW